MVLSNTVAEWKFFLRKMLFLFSGVCRSVWAHKAAAANSSANCLKGKMSMPSFVLIAGPSG